MYFSKDSDSVPTFESPWIHRGWTSVIQPLWKMVQRFLKKLGIKLPYDPAIPLLGIYPEETKIEKDTCIPLFTGGTVLKNPLYRGPARVGPG